MFDSYLKFCEFEAIRVLIFRLSLNRPALAPFLGPLKRARNSLQKLLGPLSRLSLSGLQELLERVSSTFRGGPGVRQRGLRDGGKRRCRMWQWVQCGSWPTCRSRERSGACPRDRFRCCRSSRHTRTRTHAHAHARRHGSKHKCEHTRTHTN